MGDAKEVQKLLIDQLETLAHRLDLQIQANRVLRDENNSIKEKMEWQPIETAPKDGTEIIIWCENSKTLLYPTVWTGECPGDWDKEPSHWMQIVPPRTKGGE